MTIDLELRAAADELLELIERSPVPPAPEPQRVDDLEVDYLQLNDSIAAPSEQGGRIGAFIAIAAAVVVVVGTVVVAGGDSGDIVTDPASSPDAEDPVPAPSVDDPIASPAETVPPYTAEDVTPFGGVRDERFPDSPRFADPPQCDGAVDGELLATERPSGWLQVCDAASFDGAQMYAVVAAGPGLVAVGGADECESCEPAPQIADAVVWTSPNGLSWSRVPHDESVFGGDGIQRMVSVTVGPQGLVAVGSDDPAGVEQGDAAVWTSVDGLTWSRVPHDEEVFGGPGEQRMVSVTVGPQGLVAVGSDEPAGVEQGDAAVWTSVDGLTWSRVPHDAAVFGGVDRQRMLGVTAGGPGLVAVGSDGPVGYELTWTREEGFDVEMATDAAVWTSVDGRTWSRVPHDEEVFGGGHHQMDGVTAGGPGLVAVGRDGSVPEGMAAVWTSVDGLTWTRVSYSGAGPMLSVTGGGAGLVAVGSTGYIQAWSEAVWTSPDGLTWSQLVGGAGYGQMASVTVGGPGLVAVGIGMGRTGRRMARCGLGHEPGGLMVSVAARDCLLVASIALAACGGSGQSTNSSASAGSEAVTPSTPASSVADSGVFVVEDEMYRKSAEADGEGSTVDVYVGDGSEGGPVVVLLHGFGRSGPGRPDVHLGPLGERIAELGVTVFNFGWQSTWGFSADSVADFSCVGPFVAARAAEFGADPDKIIIVGHSMGAEAGSMLAFSAFDLDPSPDCTETGQASSPVAFLGIGGAYGMVGGPLDEEHTRFRVRSFPQGSFRELDADEEPVSGLTAAELYNLDGYRAIPPVAELDIVLLIGSEDQYDATNADITAAFARALEADNVDAEVVIVEGADHEDIVDPTTEAGNATLQAVAEILVEAR